MGSIEGAYIGLSRYILEHPRDLSWFPLWYCGIPFQNAYPPLLHVLVAITAWALRISPALAHHVMGGAFYCLGPVALLFLAYALSGNLRLSFVASLLFSLISPSVFLMPSIRVDVGSFWNARRLEALVVYGDAPHIAAVTLLLFAILALHRAFERKTALAGVAAVILLASVALTNWLGTFSLAIAAISYLVALADDDSPINPGWARIAGFAALLAALAYCLASPWIPPSTIAAIQHNAQFIIGRYVMGMTQLWCGVLVLAAATGLRWVLRRAHASLCLRFGFYFLLLTAALALPAEFLHFHLMPQADRYHIEMEIAVCLVLAFGLGPLVIRTAGKYRTWLAVALLICAALQAWNYRRYARTQIRPIDIRHTVEYDASRWLQANMPNRRIFTSGSVQFWLNAFSDVPEVGGGFGQGVVNPEIPVMHYGIPFIQKNGDSAAMWLRLLGAKAVVVSGPPSRDSYAFVWTDPNKFRGVLPELWRNGGDAIYAVPMRSQSLAHAILPGDVAVKFPRHVLDFEPVRALNAALDNPALPSASFIWKNRHEAAIFASLQPQQVLFVQVSHHPGWHATVNGEPRPVRRDGLGFMIVEPRCSGPCEIRLFYDGGLEMRLARLAQAASILVMLLWLLSHVWQRRRVS